MTRKELIEKVRSIDTDAAAWLENEADKLAGDEFIHGDLNEWFIWMDSPQGYEFWKNIFIKIGGKW